MSEIESVDVGAIQRLSSLAMIDSAEKAGVLSQTAKLTRKLAATWTPEMVKALNETLNVDIEAELAVILQREIAREIKEHGSYTWEEICQQMDAK